MGVKLIYGDIAVGAKEDFTPTISDKQNFVNLSQLQQEDFTLPYYISPCELYQTILDDREMEFLPSDLNTAKTGLWSLQQSNADKTFTAPITLTLLSPQYYSSQGIMLTFDKGGNQFCTDLNVKWYLSLIHI